LRDTCPETIAVQKRVSTFNAPLSVRPAEYPCDPRLGREIFVTANILANRCGIVPAQLDFSSASAFSGNA